MVNFAFWNINKKNLLSQIIELVAEREIHYLMLAENPIPPTTVLSALNGIGGQLYFYSPNISCKKIDIFSVYKHQYLKTVGDDHRTVIKRLSDPQIGDVLIASTHLISKNNSSENGQFGESFFLQQLINSVEQQEGVEDTILVGDFNMSPFEAGVIGAGGINASMSKSISKKIRRTVQFRSYKYFYNPMWKFLGDEPPKVPGTYHYQSSDMISYQWYMFDQVVIRPSLIDKFMDGKLEIITKIKSTNLLNHNGLPDHANTSDHLPLVFTFSKEIT